MLTLQDLYQLLQLNAQLLQAERRSHRQAELLTHRAIVKDCIIEALQDKVNNIEYKALSQIGKVG